MLAPRHDNLHLCAIQLSVLEFCTARHTAGNGCYCAFRPKTEWTQSHPPPLLEIGGSKSAVIPASVRIRLSRDLQNGRPHGIEG